MRLDTTRLLRLRRDDNLDPGERVRAPRAVASSSSRGTPRFLGRVFDGGAMPDKTGRVFLLNPLSADGPETEGASVSFAVDSTRAIPVVVVGGKPPEAGDLLVALAVGGRWVAEGSPDQALGCSPCPSPRRDLTLSWAGGPHGGGSTPLVYTAPGRWNSACANQMLYSLSCPGGSVRFAVTYFVSGGCPGGQAMTCASPGDDPPSLLLDSSSCRPFFLRYTVSSMGCPALADNGITAFAISE